MIPTPNRDQPDLFSAETTWFHVFRTLIQNGDLAAMGPHAFAVYCVIKCHANFATGHSFPGIDRISALAGVSAPQVKRELVTLVDMGYLTKTKIGRSNVYQLREKVPIHDQAGQQQAVATWDYLPNALKLAVADLKSALATHDLSGAHIVHIERLTLNINTGSGPQVNVDAADIADPKMRALLENILVSVAPKTG